IIPAERDVAPFRTLAPPIADLLRPTPYPQLFAPVEGAPHPAVVGRTLYVDTVDSPVAAALLGLIQGPAGATRMAQLRVLGGAVARVAPDATAYAHRTSRVMLNIAVLYNRPEDAPAHAAWATTAAAALRQGDHRAYVNFLDAEGEERIRAAYPGATWKRLRE